MRDHKQNLRHTVHASILEELNIPGLTERDIDAKVKTVRTVFTAELANIGRTERSGAGVDDQYEPKVSWFHEADFLRRAITPRSSTSNMRVSTEKFINMFEKGSKRKHGGNIRQNRAASPENAQMRGERGDPVLRARVIVLSFHHAFFVDRTRG